MNKGTVGHIVFAVVLVGLAIAEAVSTVAAPGDVRCLFVKCVVVK